MFSGFTQWITGKSDEESDEDKLKKWQECYDFDYGGDGNDWTLKKKENGDEYDDKEYVSYFSDQWKDEKVTEPKEVKFAAMTLGYYKKYRTSMYDKLCIDLLKKAFKVFQRQRILAARLVCK